MTDDLLSFEYFLEEHESQSQELQLWVHGDEDTVVLSYNFQDKGISVKAIKNDGGIEGDGSVNAQVYGVPISGIKVFIDAVEKHMKG